MSEVSNGETRLRNESPAPPEGSPWMFLSVLAVAGRWSRSSRSVDRGRQIAGRLLVRLRVVSKLLSLQLVSFTRLDSAGQRDQLRSGVAGQFYWTDVGHRCTTTWTRASAR